jgi:fumarate reductase subunit D
MGLERPAVISAMSNPPTLLAMYGLATMLAATAVWAVFDLRGKD